MLLRWLLDEEAAQQLALDDALMLIAAAAQHEQYACVWELKSLVSGDVMPAAAVAAVLVAAARTQHYAQGVRLWRALDSDFASKAAADDVQVLEAAVTCLQMSGECEAARLLYHAPRSMAASVQCSSAAIDACVQLGEWQHALRIFDSLPDGHQVTCNSHAVAHAALRVGGHAAVCQLFFQHFSDQWKAASGAAQCVFLPSLHAQGHTAEAAALLQHLLSRGAAFPQGLCACVPILTLQGQWHSVLDCYFIIKGAGVSVPPQLFSCAINACAAAAVDFATFLTILENARACSCAMSPADWDNAATAASHGASASEMYSLTSEAHASGHTFSEAAAAALLLATNQRASAAEVVELLKLLPLPLPEHCVAAAATALVQEDLWSDALAVLENGSAPLLLHAPAQLDFQIVERCSRLFAARGIATDSSFTKAALRCRCISHLSAGDSASAANLVAAAMRSRLVHARTCVQVILALAKDAEAIESHNPCAAPGTAASAVAQQQQRRQEARQAAAALREQAIRTYQLARQQYEPMHLGDASDCVISCLHAQQRPRALLDSFDACLNSGQKLSDRSYAAAVLANETLGMHERAISLLDEIQNRKLHLTALRAGSRCACCAPRDICASAAGCCGDQHGNCTRLKS